MILVAGTDIYSFPNTSFYIMKYEEGRTPMCYVAAFACHNRHRDSMSMNDSNKVAAIPGLQISKVK